MLRVDFESFFSDGGVVEESETAAVAEFECLVEVYDFVTIVMSEFDRVYGCCPEDSSFLTIINFTVSFANYDSLSDKVTVEYVKVPLEVFNRMVNVLSVAENNNWGIKV